MGWKTSPFRIIMSLTSREQLSIWGASWDLTTDGGEAQTVNKDGWSILTLRLEPESQRPGSVYWSVGNTKKTSIYTHSDHNAWGGNTQTTQHWVKGIWTQTRSKPGHLVFNTLTDISGNPPRGVQLQRETGKLHWSRFQENIFKN